MELERAKELLNCIIDKISIDKDCIETIKFLLWLGFTDEELYGEFGFNLLDVADAEDEMDIEQV